MFSARSCCVKGLLLVFCVSSCENREIVEPSTAQMSGAKGPTGTSARPTSSSTVQVIWTDGVPNETGFRIERSATTSGPWATAGNTGPNVTSFDDGGRIGERQVCYRAFASLRSGQSNASNTSCTIPPAAPTGLTAAVFDQQAIDLAWTDNSTVEDGYEIQQATAVGGPYSTVAFVATNTTTYRQKGLATNTTYSYRVRASNDDGSGDYSNIASATPVFMAPKAPSGTNVNPSSSVSAFITWIDNSSNETGFHVQRSTDLGATWTTYYTPSTNRTFANDFGLAIEQQICYRVMAFNAQGDSPPSPFDCTTPPAGPTDLTVVAVDPQTTDLAWADNSAVEDGYEVQRSDGTAPYGVVTQLAANSTHYRDARVTGGVTYRVRATKDGGGSNVSNVASTVPPQAPVSINAAPAWSSTGAAIFWTASSTNIAGFRVERSTDGGGTWIAAATGNATTDFYYYDRFMFAEVVASEQEVCYRVIAFSSAGDSPPSNTKCTTPPAGATNLTAVFAEGGILFTWTDNSAVEDGYTLVLTTDCAEQSEVWLGGIPANTTSYLLTENWSCLGGVPGAFVIVMKDGGYGDFSNWASPAPTEP